MPVFALCDANNFYCSCERVFAPHLRGVPIVVLTDLGIKMGDPWFKIERWAVGKGIRQGRSIKNRGLRCNDTQRSLFFQMRTQQLETLLRYVARRLRDCAERVHTQKCAT